MTEDSEWAWKIEWCKIRAYPPAAEWAWRYAEEAWQQKREELAAAIAISSCWYCQIGLGQRLLGLRDVPQPPDWEKTLCEKHEMENRETLEPGDTATCDECGEEYKYWIWNRVFGNQDKRRFCKPCYRKGEHAPEGDIDRLDPREAWEIDRDEENDRDLNPLPPDRKY